jgi:3-phosphoshikimate 1-carboxyvinyltransferase
MAVYPAEITLKPWSAPPRRSVVQVPGSKSLTNRALIVGALAQGRSILRGALDSEDTRVMVAALQQLGFQVDHHVEEHLIEIEGRGGEIPTAEANLFVANSGTSFRFLTALVATGHGTYRLDGSPRMRQRPVADLLAALNRLGTEAVSEQGTGCPPVIVCARGLQGGHASVKGDISSQFLSGLLMALPYAREPTTLEVEGTLVSRPYVEMTLAVMTAFGARVEDQEFRSFYIQPARYRGYRGQSYKIEPDASAASYFFALAAITGSTMTVEGLGDQSLQGDLGFVNVLETMGCTVEHHAELTTVTGGPLRGADADMGDISDTVMTLAVVALFAKGTTRIRNVAHIRHKETDRIAALATELRRLGATVEEFPDGLRIDPPASLAPVRIATYDDHRMAMSFALAGIRAPGITILDPGCVAKTYPNFWEDLTKLSPDE